jgi:hypothetical protein
MPRNQDGGPGLREQAVDDLIRCDLTVEAVGGLVGGAVEAHANTWFALADDLLSDESSPKTWIQNGLAAWIGCFERQVDFYRGVCSTICQPPDPGGGPVGIIENGVLTITISVDAENSDPVATNIPVGAVVRFPVPPRSLDPYIRLSVSPDGKTVFLGLVGLRDGGALRPGLRRRLQTVLDVNGVPLRVVAKRLPRRPSTGG